MCGWRILILNVRESIDGIDDEGSQGTISLYMTIGSIFERQAG
jgi:hypothetical protein